MPHLWFDINRNTKKGGYTKNYPTETNIITVSSWPVFYSKFLEAKAYIQLHPEVDLIIHECWTAANPKPMFKILVYDSDGSWNLQRWNDDTNSYTGLVSGTDEYGVFEYLNFIYVNAGGGLAQGVSEFNIKVIAVNTAGVEEY